MMRQTILILLAVLLLAACDQAVVTPTVTASATHPPVSATPTPTRTASPSRTPTPRPTATALRDSGPTPAAKLPTNTLILPPTHTPQPTPIVAIPDFGGTPARSVGSYTLNPWNGDEAWNIINTGLSAFPADLAGSYDFGQDWAMVELTLLREITARFSDSVHYSDAGAALISPDLYLWLSIPVENTLEPFRQALESAVNANPEIEVSSQALDQIIADQLQHPDIHVLQVLPANNVLGDGAPGWILDVRMGAFAGAAFALTGEPGAYHLISPRSDWRPFMWSEQWVLALDLNANGIPEIAIQDSFWGMGMTHLCREIFQLYEWNGSSFVNLTPGLSTWANTDVGGCLGFEFSPGPNGTQAITTGNRILSWCRYNDLRDVGILEIERRYEWNGQFFTLVNEDIAPLEASMPEGYILNRCSLWWVYEAGAENDQAFQLLPSLLETTDPELIAGFTEIFGPAYLDFFRFKLGTWYAMRGQQAQALALLTQVRDQPANPKYTGASQLAEAFLQEYPATGAYAGCAAANQIVVGTSRDNWGFSDYHWYYWETNFFNLSNLRLDPMNICSLATAFRLAVQNRSFANSDGLKSWLSGQGIPYTGMQEGDLDGDGRSDWLVLLGTGHQQSWHLWALLNRGGHTIPLWVSDTRMTTENIPAALNFFTPAENIGSLIVYQWPKEIIVFRVVTHDSWSGIEVTYQDFGSEETYLGFSIRSPDGGAEELYIERIGDEIRQTDWYVLGWDSVENTLATVSSPQLDQDEQIHAAEWLLFEQNDPQAALVILNTLLDDETQLVEWGYGDLPRIRPYLQYLLGLAYEMSGDQQNAILAYWSLWNSYPLHPLSYVVQQKLELVSQP